MSSMSELTNKPASMLQRWLWQPSVRLAHRIERRSLARLGAVQPSVAALIEKHNAAGTDAATASTKRYLQEQRQLLSYRVVRFFDECRYLLSGEYFRQYNRRAFIVDLRFATQVLFLFIIGVLCGRRGVFPPISPDSPFVLGLEHKANPNY